MTTENPYIKQFPELMAGKTVLYCHGFASSGQSGTVARLREVMPQSKVIAPDLPIHPQEAISMLKNICQQEQPSLIIGTSMGGMYAEQLRGFDRICVNPAMEMGETMKTHGMTGTQQFQNPRLDGVQEFYVDKALVKEYKDQSEHRFEDVSDEDRQRVYGLFGDEDTTVNTFDMFHEVYPHALHFHGEHRMNDKSFMHSVVPVIRWIDDKQEHRERPIIYIGMETLMDAFKKPASLPRRLFGCLLSTIRSISSHHLPIMLRPPRGLKHTSTYPLGTTPSSPIAATCSTATTLSVSRKSATPCPPFWNTAPTPSRHGTTSSTIFQDLEDSRHETANFLKQYEGNVPIYSSILRELLKENN